MAKLLVLLLLIASLLGCRDSLSETNRGQSTELGIKHGVSPDSLGTSNVDVDSKDRIYGAQASPQVGMPEGAATGEQEASLLPASNSEKSAGQGTGDAAGSEQSNVEFERMLQGFLRCRYDGLWVPYVVGHRSDFPENPYFEKHSVKLCGADEEFSYYCMEEVFHGLDVTRMAVPVQGGVPRVSIYVRQDLRLARKILKEKVGSEFRESAASAEGLAPEIAQDPRDSSRSVLICNRDF